MVKQKNSGSGRGAKAAGSSAFDLDSIERLMNLMKKHDVLELEVLNGPDRKVRLSRRTHDAPAYAPPMHHATHAVVGAPPPSAPAPAAGGKPAKPDGAIEFTSPMVGTFYRAPSPESPPFVTPGDKVAPDTLIAIIEAMKVMNEIRAEVAGEIIDVLAENGEAVEFGQPLFLIKKTG